ncbi:MAG: LptF/LptG family permease [Flavobacteriales bacterium]|nr:LptF/LptG family permease [Flavobacteriales bacterium]
MKRIDRYIIVKYLTTFFVALGLIIALSIVFDLSEKIDDFMGKHGKIPTTGEIVFDYYLNFIPYFAGLFAPLFVFISVIYFTSRMAFRSEIIAILASGVSYKRFVAPFAFTALLVSVFLIFFINFVIPQSNLKKVAFEKEYFGQRSWTPRNIHRRLAENEFLYMEFWMAKASTGNKFSIERFDDSGLRYKLMAQSVKYDSLSGRWKLNTILERFISPEGEVIKRSEEMDTIFSFTPQLFSDRNLDVSTMDWFELNTFISEEISMGSTLIPYYLVEKYKRLATPFSTLILTLIAVPLAGRKVRGGIGLHIGIGIGLGFTYIFFDKVSTTYAVSGIMNPLLAVWLPNLIFLFIAFYLLSKAQR